MNINNDIVKYYLENKHLKEYQSHWIFNKIVPGTYTYEEPKDICFDKLTNLYEIINQQFKMFKPMNSSLWKQLFEGIQVPNSLIVYLIVGAPSPFDAMVRESPNGETCIIFDLVRISSYSEDTSELIEIVNNFLTHESSHVLIEQKYPYLDTLSLYDTFCQIIFDEGIAHYLSFSEDITELNWETKEMANRKVVAYNQIRYYLENPGKITKQVLMEANSGRFWDKFGSIGGMFAVKEYYERNNSLSSLLDQGPSVLIQGIMD